jgi:hypothetical protein
MISKLGFGCAALALASFAACDSGDSGSGKPEPAPHHRDAGDHDAASATKDGSTTDAGDAGARAACEGFALKGLKYSPGGSVLPNKCKPFDATTNNPYAVRCVDAWPDYHTRFAGDEYCILPPPPDQGIQVGVHPQGQNWFAQVSTGDMSGYDTDAPEWVLPPGGENTVNYISGADNPEAHNYYRTYFRMRTGSHHDIITLHEAGAEREVWVENAGGEALPGLFGSSAGKLIASLGGEQRPDDNTPVTLDKPKEDAGLYLVWPANPTILYNMHHFNVTDHDILKENWANLWWEDDDATTRVSWFMGLDIDQVGSLSVAPGETKDMHYAFAINAPTRVVRVFGHRHAWTSNFSSWVEHDDGKLDLIYQSFNWADMPTYRYDSMAKNPPLNPKARSDGATTGVLMLDQGDTLHFNCHIAFTDERSSAVNSPATPEAIGKLGFSNQAFDGEMCIEFGNITGPSIGRPVASAAAVPDFAKLD